jgi:scyllo-inositol 2-dehydrogenase (NADP+)
MEKLNVGLIGFGLSGKVFHAPLLNALPGFEVTKVFSSRTSEVLEAFPRAQVVRDVQEIVNDPGIDLVINCAPNSHHYSYSKAALEAKKHVLVEKPFVNTVAEGEELIRLAQKSNRILSVFQNRRWDNDFLTIQKLLQEKTLGDIRVFESNFDRLRPQTSPEKWREVAGPGSGILFDLGAHLIDQALVLFGIPDSYIVDAELQREGAEAHDYFHIILKYGSMRAVLRSSSFTQTTPRFHVQGTKGSYKKYGLDPQEAALKAGADPLQENFGKEGSSESTELILDGKAEKIKSEKGHYLGFYQQLYQALSGNDKTKNPVKPEEALEVIRIIEEGLKAEL